jgi:hypothetical protein
MLAAPDVETTSKPSIGSRGKGFLPTDQLLTVNPHLSPEQKMSTRKGIEPVFRACERAVSVIGEGTGPTGVAERLPAGVWLMVFVAPVSFPSG